MSKPWSDATLVGALWNYFARTGRRPTFEAWPGSKGGLPGRSAYPRRWGTWSEALRAAGFDPPLQGSSPPNEEFMAEVARRHDEEGVPLSVMAREVGITGQALGRRLRRYHQRVAMREVVELVS